MNGSNTAFARWLERRDEAAWAFAKRIGVSRSAVLALAGVRSHRSPAFFKTQTLEKISMETGITVRRLYEDWIRAEPRDPRPYRRKTHAATE